MKAHEILSKVDHTQLSQTASWDDIRRLCDEAAKFGTATVCIPSSYVEEAAAYMKSINGSPLICTCVGFPNGYSSTAAKVFEAKDAIAHGADEIDMVINQGWVKDNKYEQVLEEIHAVKAACGDHVLKVIIETCNLTDEEKVRMCRVVTESGADYIKTSTGFASGGATFEDVALFAANVGPSVKIKAAGGIRSMEDAKKFAALGASRLGTSRIVKVCIDEGLTPDSEI